MLELSFAFDQCLEGCMQLAEIPSEQDSAMQKSGICIIGIYSKLSYLM